MIIHNDIVVDISRCGRCRWAGVAPGGIEFGEAEGRAVPSELLKVCDWRGGSLFDEDIAGCEVEGRLRL